MSPKSCQDSGASFTPLDLGPIEDLSLEDMVLAQQGRCLGPISEDFIFAFSTEQAAGSGIAVGARWTDGKIGESGADALGVLGGEILGLDQGDEEGEDEDELAPGPLFTPLTGAASVVRPGIVHRLDKGTTGDFFCQNLWAALDNTKL